MAPFVNLFLRSGFNPSQFAPQGVMDSIDDVHEYPIDSRFSDVLNWASEKSAPYVMFADDAIGVDPETLDSLVRILKRNTSLPGLTLGSEALSTVFGLPPHEVRRDAVRQSLIPMDCLPPWLCVLNRRLLQQFVESNEFQTLEFFLFDVNRRLRQKGINVFRLEDFVLFDTRYWVSDLFRHKSQDLASDYELYSQTSNGNGAPIVPPQFRVRVVGEFDRQVPLANPGHRKPASDSEPPTVSIICPAYKPGFFKETLESVMSQSSDDWEFRVLIDGPPEPDRRQLLSICQEYADHPRFFCSDQANRGTGPTRCQLAKEAVGEFVLSVDDDDMLMPETVETFLAAIQSYPGVEFFRGGAQMVGLIDRYHPPRSRVVVDGISADTFEVTQPFLIRRETLERLGGFRGDESIKGAGEDTDLFLKIDRVGLRTVIIDRPLYRRRLSLSNQSLGFQLPSALGHLDTIDKRFTPRNWMLTDRLDEEDDLYTASTLTYTNPQSGVSVHCPTRYFSYQTVGDTRDRAIDFEITSVCNAVCPFCPREVLSGKNKHMLMESVCQFEEQLRNEQGPGRRVVLCGIGEPTLHPNVDEIVQRLAPVTLELCMTTNGSLMDGDRFERFIELGLNEVNFSLNATTNETHRKVMALKNFDRVMDNVNEVLERLVQYPDMKVHVSFVYCNLNQHEAVPFVEHWRNRNVTNVWVHPVNNRAGLLNPDVKPVDTRELSVRYADDSKVVIALLPHGTEEQRICRIARDMDFISVDGAMRLCAMDYERKTFFGSVGLMSLQDMWSAFENLIHEL